MDRFVFDALLDSLYAMLSLGILGLRALESVREREPLERTFFQAAEVMPMGVLGTVMRSSVGEW